MLNALKMHVMASIDLRHSLEIIADRRFSLERLEIRRAARAPTHCAALGGALGCGGVAAGVDRAVSGSDEARQVLA